MRIVFYRYNSICEPDIIHAFEELGHTVTEITEEMTRKDLTPQETIQIVSKVLFEGNADCVFSINFFPAVSEVCNIFKLPYLCWIVDSPVMELYTKSIQNPWNRVFLFDYALYQEFSPLNPDCIFHLPLATNVADKDRVIGQASRGLREKFRADVAFVGSLYTEKNPYDKLTNPPEDLRGYLDGLMEAQLRVYGYYFIEECLTDEVIDRFKSHFPTFFTLPGEHFLTDRKTLAQLYIGNKISALERKRVMEALSKRFCVDIYTGSDTSSLPKLHNRGFAKTLTEMPIIFHEAKINLNISSKAIRTGIPLRVWDVLGCGGFLISNYQTELPGFLTVGEDLVTYGSIEELTERTEYYLSHEKERKEIARNGYEKVKEYHTYTVRVALMLAMAFGTVFS